MIDIVERYHQIRRALFAGPDTQSTEHMVRSMYKPSNDAASIIAAILTLAEAVKPTE